VSIALFITSKQYSLLYSISAYHLKLSTSFVGNDFCGVHSLAHDVSQCRIIADSVLAAASPFLMSPPRQGSFLSHSRSTAVPREIKDLYKDLQFLKLVLQFIVVFYEYQTHASCSAGCSLPCICFVEIMKVLIIVFDVYFWLLSHCIILHSYRLLCTLIFLHHDFLTSCQ
jgi:hypothetical protein